MPTEPMKDEELRKWAEAQIRDRGEPCKYAFCPVARAVLSLLDRQRWIPVSEKLPEPSCDFVLMFMPGNDGKLDCKVGIGYVWKDGKWEGDIGDCQPAHWMPLPAPPAETETK